MNEQKVNLCDGCSLWPCGTHAPIGVDGCIVTECANRKPTSGELIATLKARRDELLLAARAYQELSVCYRLNKRPTEKLFDRLETANFAIANAEKDKL